MISHPSVPPLHPAPATPIAQKIAGQLLLLSLVLSLSMISPALADCPGPLFLDEAEVYPTGPNPPGVVIADFNKDGVQDLVVGNSSIPNDVGASSSISILIGLSEDGIGTGEFAPALNFPTVNPPLWIATGDFNEDGITDVVSTDFGGSYVSVFLGQGEGGVWNGDIVFDGAYAVGINPFRVITGDFNDDDILDLVVSRDQRAGYTVLLGDGIGGVGDGTFSLGEIVQLTGSSSTGLSSGDFNEDGITDLVISDNTEGKVYIFLGDGANGVGDGTFTQSTFVLVGGSPYDFAIADYSGDDILDIAASLNNAGGGTTILIGNGANGVGNGTFSFLFHIPSGNSTAIASTDFNCDEIPDLLINSPSPSRVTPYLGVGNGAFIEKSSQPVGNLPSGLAIGDFNQDGLPDAAVASYLESFVNVLLGVCEVDGGIAEAPQLISVRDVPNDQGGKVFLTWLRSSHDAFSGLVFQYRIWRRVPPGLVSSAKWVGAFDDQERFLKREQVASDLSLQTTFWEAIATVPAQRLEGYGYTAATTQDSIKSNNPFTAFFVTALTSDIDLVFDSEVDSGYSVDNLAPGKPFGFLAREVGPRVQLEWLENAEPDLWGYRIYKGDDAEFVPTEDNKLVETVETTYLDLVGGETATYKISALDVHGNESEYSVLNLSPPIGAPAPNTLNLALHELRPYPVSKERLTVEFTLPNAASALIELFDVSGRRLVSRSVGSMGPGRYSLSLEEEHRLSSGVYVIRLTQAGQTRTQRVVIAR